MIRKIVLHTSLLNFTTTDFTFFLKKTTDFKDLSHKLSMGAIDIVEK